MSENLETNINLVGLKSDEASRKVLAKRVHDMTSAVRSLRFLADALSEGYRFDDAAAADKITYINKAVTVLEREEKLLRNLFESSTPPHAVLIDDDPLICAGWELLAKKRGKRLLAFRTSEELRQQLIEIPREVPIFVDSYLGETERGERLAEELHHKGFSSVYLVTGYSANQFAPMPWLKGILDKTPPEWLF